MVEAALVLIGCDEASAVLGGNWKWCSSCQLFVDDETLGELRAGVVRTLGAVGESSLHDARPDRTRFIDETRVLGHATVADDLFGGDAKAKVLVPAVAEHLPAGGIRFDVRAIGQAQVTPKAASREDLVHNAFDLHGGIMPPRDSLQLSAIIVACPVRRVKDAGGNPGSAVLLALSGKERGSAGQKHRPSGNE